MKKAECSTCKQEKCCPCPKCKDFSQDPPCSHLENRLGIKKWVFRSILCLALVGLLGPFLAQCILPFCFPNVTIETLEIWNQYVSIVLGIVATLLSIVSLIIAFHTTSEGYEQQRKTFEQYLSTIELLHKVEKDVAIVDAKFATTKANTSQNDSSDGDVGKILD